MKKMAFFCGLTLFLFGCQEKHAGSNTFKIPTDSLEVTLSIDTILIDAGDDFIYLNHYLRLSDFSADRRFLHNFNPLNYEMELIDLQEKRLVEKYRIEKEGPKTVPNHFFYRLQVAEETEELFFQTTSHIYKTDLQGKVQSSYRFMNDSLSDFRYNPENQINLQGFVSENGKHFYSFYTDTFPDRKRKGLVRVDFKEKQVDFREMDFFHWANDFDLYYREPDGRYNRGEYPEMSGMAFKGDSIIFSISAVNKLWVYHFQSGYLKELSYESTLTKNQKEGNFPKRVESMEAFQEAAKQKNEEVYFHPIQYDPKNQRFLRVTTQFEGYDKNGEAIYNSYLTIFDKELQPIQEQLIPEPGFYPSNSKSFIKDGVYYSYLNMDDELAFIRLKVE
ncbi:DUF4221 family protein [Algoriphagus sp. CAU 1675]|uniref:DUF4221 family protein n=1 Tax=Algoriphagus sp. CAU 1675 TaxID=3032597 RepID=UPI0023DC4F8D|nr:DUF4221 family protein [Algoriphagus sp. CAU 1675]MDF2156374.1 DUF4221 family protein [Algoriphagus sp. CAU 1675]